MLYASLLELIAFFSSPSVSFLLLPNSSAATMLIALASPIPLNCFKSEIESFPNLFKSFLMELKIRFESSTAVSFLLPELINMAINSASDSAPLPFESNFSRGLSSSAHALIFNFSGYIFLYPEISVLYQYIVNVVY